MAERLPDIIVWRGQPLHREAAGSNCWSCGTDPLGPAGEAVVKLWRSRGKWEGQVFFGRGLPGYGATPEAALDDSCRRWLASHEDQLARVKAWLAEHGGHAVTTDAIARWARDPRDPAGRAPRTLGELLRAVREDRGLLQWDVAVAIGKRLTTVAAIEAGGLAFERTIAAFLAAVGASPEHIAEARRLGWRS